MSSDTHDHDHDHATAGILAAAAADWRPDWRPTRLPQTALLLVIRAYQLTLSKLMPVNTCRFYPSCSRYGFEAIRRHGAARGSLMAAWRVLRCNPFNPGGYDPVP